MKRPMSWFIIAGVGLSLMAFSYFNYQHTGGTGPWKEALMYIGKEQPNVQAEGFEYETREVLLLPLPRRAENFRQIAHSFGPYAEKSYLYCYQEKVVLYPDLAGDFSDNMLEWGRLPLPDANEVLAGFHAANKEKVTINRHTFSIVGQFKKEVVLFAESYLIAGENSARRIFDTDDENILYAHILRLSKRQLTDSKIKENLDKVFPKAEFVPYAPVIRIESGPFYLYIAGMLLLLLGASVGFLKTYILLAGRLKNIWLRLPLLEIAKYRKLFLAVHLIYFGFVILFMIIAYSMPELQTCLLTGIKSQVVDGSGPLGIAGKAYMSKNIPLAAVTTFVINLTIGSLAFITVPSIILPGIGILTACYRAILWGLLLAPSIEALSGSMLPHSVTLLLEGEGYIVASFFSLLILIYLFRKSEAPRLSSRYGKALLLNIRANLLVAIILAIAAIYEAVEVILAIM